MKNKYQRNISETPDQREALAEAKMLMQRNGWPEPTISAIYRRALNSYLLVLRRGSGRSK
jgi:hypothetical protein